MLDAFGFAEAEHASVLITVDKLDKVGTSGVLAELRERGATAAAVDRLEAFFERPKPEDQPFGEAQIRSQLPAGVSDDVIAELAAIGTAAAESGSGTATPVIFDPFLVRGMGYYTGPIFEIEHPDLGYSLGGGGRYDGMIGRFLGQDVPATGFSIGFERIVDLLELPEDAASESIALVYDRDVTPGALIALKSALVATGKRVRLEKRTKNLKVLLDRVTDEGFRAFAFVTGDTASVSDLEVKPLG